MTKTTNFNYQIWLYKMGLVVTLKSMPKVTARDIEYIRYLVLIENNKPWYAPAGLKKGL